MDGYSFLITILLVEFGIILVCTFFIFFRRFFFIFYKQRTTLRITDLKESFFQLLTVPASFSVLPKKQFKFFQELLIVLRNFNQKLRGTDWEQLKFTIGEQFLLPKAKSYAKSFFWKRKFLASEAFALVPSLECEEVVLPLIHDDSFLVSNNAVKALIAMESKRGIHNILHTLKEDDGFSYFLTRDHFSRASKNVFLLIIELLNDPELRLVCLDLLTMRCVSLPIPSLSKEVDDPDPDIRLLALEVLILNPLPNTALILEERILDPLFQIRRRAAYGMSLYKTEQTETLLKNALTDSSWEVALEAAKSLKRIGILNEKLIKQTKSATARAILNYALQFGD